MNCKKCGANLPNDAEYCAFCGTKIVKEKYCPRCGYKCAENYLYCLKCGYKFEDIPATTSNEPNCTSPRIINNKAQNISSNTTNGTVKNTVAFVKRKKSVLISIVCFFLSLMIFVSSFFGVVTVNISRDLVNATTDSNVHFARNINADLSAIDLIKYSCFTISLNEEKARDLKIDYDVKLEKLYADYALEIAPFITVTTEGITYVNEKGCEKIEEFLNNTEFLLTTLEGTYIYGLLALENSLYISASSIQVPLKTAGIFALLTIIASGITLIVSILSIFIKNLKGLNVLLAITFIFSIIATSLATYEKNVSMGEAYIFIMVVFALYYVVNMAVKIISDKQISLGTALSKSAVIVSSIVALAMFSSPVINVLVESNDFSSTNFEYTYNYSHFEICDSVFPQIPFDQRESGMDFNDTIEELLGKEDVNPLELKMYLGIDKILQNRSMNPSTSVIAIFIPIMSLLSLFAFAFLFAVNVATTKHTKLFNCITLVIITTFLLASIIICYSLPGLIASIATFSFSAGSGLIVQLVFACIALVASIASLFTEKYVFVFGKKVQTATNTSLANNTISEENIAKENDLATTPLEETTTPQEENANNVLDNQQQDVANASTPNDLANC